MRSLEPMCNHYVKNTEVMEWAVNSIPGARMSETTRAALKDLTDHTYPKYTAGVVTQIAGERELVAMRWAVHAVVQGQSRFITNARSDKFAKGFWRPSAKKRRCLVPATGYFEPGLGPVGAKGEVLFAPVGRPHFFIAGVFDHDPAPSDSRGFALVTAEPNAYAARFHDRMPVVLSDAEALRWLGDEPLPDDELQALCRGLPADQLTHTEIPATPKLPQEKITKPALRRAIDDNQGDLFT